MDPASTDIIYGHKMPSNFILTQDRSQLRAYNANATDPEGRGFEVFVNNLPRDILIQYVYNFMQQCGDIYDIRFLMDFSGFNRGMCFVKFLTKMAARKAALVLDALEILPNHSVSVRMSFDNNQLMMPNIPKHVPHYQVSELITSIIGEGLTSVSVMDQKKEESKNCCILTYESHRRALEARKKLWPGVELWGTNIFIDWAEPPELKQILSAHQAALNLVKNWCSMKGLNASPSKTVIIPFTKRRKTSFQLNSPKTKILSRVLYFRKFPENATRSELFELLKTAIDIHSVLKFRLADGSGFIIFKCDSARQAAYKILTESLILGRKLEVSCKKIFSTVNIEKTPGSISEDPSATCHPPTNDHKSVHNGFMQMKIDEPKTPPVIEYRSCTIAMIEQLPVFYPPPVQTVPGIYNELEAIQKIVQGILEKNFPNSSWTCLDPGEKEITLHCGAIRIRPTVNGETYEFVLLCVSSDVASGSTGFSQ